MKSYKVDGELYENLVFTTDRYVAVCLQTGLQLGGYNSKLIKDVWRGRDGWRLLIGIKYQEILKIKIE